MYNTLDMPHSQKTVELVNTTEIEMFIPVMQDIADDFGIGSGGSRLNEDAPLPPTEPYVIVSHHTALRACMSPLSVGIDSSRLCKGSDSISTSPLLTDRFH